MENFVLYDELGRGEQRVVYKGRRKGTVNYFAIHCVEKSRREDLQNSVRISHNLNNENVVKFYEWYETSNHLWLVVELCTGITLEKILLQDSSLPEATIRKFGKDVIEALFYLHSNNILYCDLSPSKVILDGSGVLKLSNFSLAKIEGEQDALDEEHEDLEFGQEEQFSKRLVRGLPFYISPEVLIGGFHTKQSDLWSLGCLLYECFTGKPPYVATHVQDLVSLITSTKVPYPIQEKNHVEIKASDDFHSLLKLLLTKDPSKRICLEDLCLHKFWLGSLAHLLEDRESQTFEEENMKYFENESREDLEFQDGSATHQQRSTRQNKNKFGANNEDIDCSMEEKDQSFCDSIVVNDFKINSGGTLGKGLALLDLRSVGKISLDASVSMQRSNENYSRSRESKRKVDLNESPELSFDKNVKQTNRVSRSGHAFDVDVTFIDLLYHPSDLEVSPIIENMKLSKQSAPKWDAHIVPCPTHRGDKINLLTKQELDHHVNSINETIASFSKGSKTAESHNAQRVKLHTLGYLISIARNETVANVFLEKNVVKLLMNDLKSSAPQEIKLRVARLLGILACSATYISPNFKMAEVFNALTESLRDHLCVTSLKTVLLPALGEFMFYAATQEEGEDKIIASWEPPGAAFTIVTRCLQSGEEVSVQHTAAKIIDNIATTAGRYCKKFLTKEVAHNLWSLFSHAVSDAEKFTSISALSRLTMHSNAVFLQVVERVGIEEILKTLFACSTRIQQPLLTVLTTLLSNSIYSKKIAQDSSIATKVTRILETPSFVVRGKVYLFIGKICENSTSALLDCCQAKLVTYIERDCRKTTSTNNTKGDAQTFVYLKQCVELVVTTIRNAAPRVLQEIVKALEAVCGRQHPPPSHMKLLRSHLPNLAIILHVVTSQIFRPQIINDDFLESLGTLLSYMQTVDDGQTNISSGLGTIRPEEIVRTTFSIVEAVSQHPLLLLEYRKMFIQALLPSLGSFCTSSSGDSRILSMKIFSDVCSLYIENEECSESARGNTADKTNKLLDKIIIEYFLGRIDDVIQDQDPIPAYGIKLLNSFIDHNKDVGSRLVDDGMLTKVIDLFETHQSDTRSSVLLAIVNVISSMVASKNSDLPTLLKQGLVEYLMTAFIAISSVLEEDTSADHASSLFIPLLDTLRLLLKGLESGVKRVVRSKEETRSQNEISKDVALMEEQLKACRILSELNGVLITLLCFDDQDVQDLSCQCLYLSAELFGGEYEDCFSEDNLECLSDAIQLFDDKRKKLLLRIIKRFITSSPILLQVIKENGDELCTYMKEISSQIITATTNSDQRAVKTIASEILDFLETN